MPRAGFTTLSAGMALLAGILASWLSVNAAGSDENAGQPATLSLDPITESIVVSGGRLSASSESRSGMVVRVIEESVVSQPPPFSSGRTVVVPRTRIVIEGAQGETWAPLRPNESAESLIEKLNQMNLRRDELVAVLESLKRKGIYRGGVIYKD